MKKNIMIIALVIVLVFSLAGCGNKNVDNTKSVTGESKTNVSDVTETDDENQIEVNSENLETESREDNEYIESEDIFEVTKIDDGDGIDVVDFSEMELFSEHYVIPESINIYSYFGTYAGYTKPGIEITSGRRNDEWICISFATSSYLVKAEDFDKIAQIVVDKEDSENGNYEPDIEEVTFTPGTPQSNSEAISPKQETETQEVASDKYTAEDAVATYRSIMESNGISFDPSLKEYASWGTGMLPLDKNEVEYLANSSVKSYAMGDSGGHSWTKYYLEVTGSDENYVYYTAYHGY